jgi:hypothetical protein
MAPLFLLAAPQVTLRSLFDRPSEEMNLAWIKLFIAAAAILALFYEASRQAEGNPVAPRARKAVAGFLAFASIVAYFQFFNTGYQDFYHRWEFFHYYVGSKYFRELGYDNLYRCTAVAELDLGYQRDVRARKLRDLGHTNLIISTTEALAHPEVCKDVFSTERWDAFKKDVDFFRKEAGAGSWWHDMQKDHGYNPTPVWGLTGWLFASLHPAEKWYMQLLSGLDLGLFAATFGCVAWAFGWRVAALGIIFWGTQGASPFFWTGGAFLRQDWLFFTIASACMVRKRKYFWGGAFLMYGTLLRVFPLFFFGGWAVVAAAYAYRAYRAHARGPGGGGDVEAKGYRDFKRSAKAAGDRLTLNALLHPQLKLVATGALAAGLVLIPASVAVDGVRAWPDFVQHILVHNKTPLTNHMGWRTIVGHAADGRMQFVRDNRLIDPFSKWKDMRRERVQAKAAFYYGGIALMGAFFVYACWHLKNLWVVEALGCLLVMLGSELTCYYFSFFIFAAMLSRGRKPLEVGLLAASVLTQFCTTQYVFYDDRFTGMTVVFLNLALFMLALYTRRPKATLAEVMTPAPAVTGALSVPPAADG